MNSRFALAGFMETRVPVDLRSMLSDREGHVDDSGHRRYGFLMKKKARVPYAVCTVATDGDDDGSTVPAWGVGDCFARQCSHPNFTMVYCLNRTPDAVHIVYERESMMLTQYLEQVQSSYLADEVKRLRGLSVVAQILVTMLWAWDAGFDAPSSVLDRAMVYQTTNPRHDYHARNRVFRVRTQGVCVTIQPRGNRRDGGAAAEGLFCQWMAVLHAAYGHGDAAGGGAWIQRAIAILEWAVDGSKPLPESAHALAHLCRLTCVAPEDVIPVLFSRDALADAGVDAAKLVGVEWGDEAVDVCAFDADRHRLNWTEQIHGAGD